MKPKPTPPEGAPKPRRLWHWTEKVQAERGLRLHAQVEDPVVHTTLGDFDRYDSAGGPLYKHRLLPDNWILRFYDDGTFDLVMTVEGMAPIAISGTYAPT